MDNKLSFVCRKCDAIRYGSESVICGHSAKDYSLAEPTHKPENVRNLCSGFVYMDGKKFTCGCRGEECNQPTCLCERHNKPEEKSAPFVEEDLEGLPDPNGFKKLFGPENDTDGGLK